MSNWNNLDTLDSYKALSQKEQVNLADVMSGEDGAKRVQTYQVAMAADLSYNYASKQVNDDILKALSSLAEEAELAEKYKEICDFFDIRRINLSAVAMRKVSCFIS